jgi:tape measure domain-containing protein
MGESIFELEGSVGLDVSKATSGLDALEKYAQSKGDSLTSVFERAGKKAGQGLSTGISIGLGDVGKAVDALVSITESGLRGIPVVGEGIAAAYHEVSGVLVDATARGYAYNDFLKQQRIELDLVTGSASQTKREVTEIADIAFRTNVGKSFLTDTVQDLQLFNVEGPRALALVRGLSNQATATGGGAGRVVALTDLVERVLETGKLDTRAVRQLIRQKVPVYDIIADELQVSKQKAAQLINSGALSGEDLITIFTSQFNKPKWQQAAEEMTQTVDGLTQRYNAGVNKLLGVATQPAYNTSIDFLQKAVEMIRGPQAASVATDIQTAITPVTTMMESVGKALASGDVFGGAVKSGNSIVEGLEKGIKEKAGAAVNAVKGLGTSGINALNEVWDTHSPSQVAADIGGMVVEGFANGRGGRGGLSSEESKAKVRAAVEGLMREPAIQAFLKIIQRSELGAGETNPYARAFGHGGHRDPMSLDPSGSNWYGERVWSPTLNRMVPTHAFGAYQFEPGTFRSLARQLGLTDVSPQSQDMAAVLDLIHHRGAVPSIMGGDVRGAMSATRGEWESFALRLRSGKTGDLQNLFNQLAVGGSPVSTTNPMPVTVVGSAASPAGASADWSKVNFNGLDDKMWAGTENDPALTEGLKQMADSVTLVGSHAKDSGVYVAGIGDVAQKEVVPALVMMAQLMAEDAQAAEGMGARGTDAMEKLRAKVHSLSFELRQYGLDSKDISAEFERDLSSAFDHLGEKGHNFAVDFGLGLLQDFKHTVGEGLSVTITDALFGKQNDQGGRSGGLFNTIFGSLFGGGKTAGGGIGSSIAAALGPQTATQAANTAALTADTTAVTAGSATTTVNTTATELNTFALNQLTFTVQNAGLFGGGGGGGGGGDDSEGSGGGLGSLLGKLVGAVLGGIGGGKGDLPIGGTDGKVTGFATGGSFIVGGQSGTDKNLVQFMATRGEKVTVETPEQQRRDGGVMVVQHHTHNWYVNAPAGFESLLSRDAQAAVERRTESAMHRANLYAYPQQ